MQSRGFHPSRPGCYFASSFVEKLYVTAISPAKAQPIAPAGVGARATPARVRALAQILTGFGSAASAEDMDSDSRSASTSFFMTSPFFQSIRDTSISSSKRSSKAHPAPRPAERRSFDEEPEFTLSSIRRRLSMVKNWNGGAVRPGRAAVRTGGNHGDDPSHAASRHPLAPGRLRQPRRLFFCHM